MHCDETRRYLLDLDGNEAARRRVAAALQHAETCSACRSALADYDRIRDEVAAPQGDIEPPGGWVAFEARLKHKIQARSWWRWFSPVAMAASLLLAGAGWGLYLGGRPELAPGRPEEETPRLVSLSPQDVAQGVRLFDQVSDVFERRADWVLLANGASDLGLGPRSSAGGRELLLLRLALVREQAVVSSADLVIAAGRTASVTLPLDRGAQVSYQVATSASDPRRLRLGVSIRPSAQEPRSLAALATELDAEGERWIQAGQLVTHLGQFGVSVQVCRAPTGLHS